MQRLIDAFFNSVRAFRKLAASEKAFQQELMLLVLALPLGWFVSVSWRGYALLIGAVLLEANDEWQLQHRYMQVEGMAGFAPALSEESITTLPPQAA